MNEDHGLMILRFSTAAMKDVVNNAEVDGADG